MTKLESILNSKIFYIILAILAIFHILVNNIKPHISSYDIDDNVFSGRLDKITIKDTKITYTIDVGKENLICNYYLSDRSIPPDIKETYKLGYILEIKGTLKAPTNNTVPNTFNYKNYLNDHNTYYTCTVEEIRVKDQKINLFYKIKNFIIERIDSFRIKDYLYTMIVGDKSLLDEETFMKYRQNGVTHLFAISGMHVGLFTACLLKLFKKVGAKRRYFIVIPFIWFYTFLAGFTPSILRSCVLFTIISIFKISNIKVSTLRSLYITCFILVFIDYNIVKDIGFIYSFLTTFGLVYSNKVLQKHKIIGTSLIATLYSLPITVNNFYKINLLSPIFNIIFVPFVSVIIYPLCLLTFIFRFLEPVTMLGISFLELINNLLSKIDFLYIVIPKMGIIILIIYYVILLLYLSKGFYKTSLILLAIVILNKTKPFFDSSYYVEFIDVGQGDSILIRTRWSKEVILIDTGGKIYSDEKSSYYVSANTITYLNSLGIDKIDYTILTHGDADHMGDAINVVNNIRVDKVVFNCGVYNDLENQLIKVLDIKKIEYFSCIEKLDIDNHHINFLNTEEYDNENDSSNIIYAELDSYKFLFMGDASVKVEQDLLNKYNLSNIDILKVGHHGSKTSSSKEFIDTISPKIAIISVGKNNRYGHPNKEVLENLENSIIYRTDVDGSIMFEINKKLKIETFLP